MTTTDLIKHQLTRSPLIAVTVYLALMTAFAAVIWGPIADAQNDKEPVGLSAPRKVEGVPKRGKSRASNPKEATHAKAQHLR